MSDLPSHERPRERLARLGAEALADRELVAVLLGTGGAARQSAPELADRLLATFGGVAGLSRASEPELCRVGGVGPSKAAALRAAFALGRRADDRPAAVTLANSSAVADAARPWLAARTRERAIVLSCDARNRLLGVDVVSEGALDATALPSREILAAVLRRDGRAFALAHNHPSGDPTPSAADCAATERIRAAAGAVGLRVLDHVIIAGSGWRSVTSAR